MSGTVNNGLCVQHVDDTTTYQHCKVKNIKRTINHLKKELTHLLKWSKEEILVSNPSKTKLMIIGTKQMARVLDLDNKSIQVS